ncbi:MAG: PH domain-containing protein [Planctomycetota bacterium]|jgi:putative membrane protein
MTSSEPPFPAPEPEQGPQPEPPASSEAEAGAEEIVLAAGHLHPGMLFLRMLDGFRQALLPVILGIVTQQLWLGFVAVGFFLLAMVYALARYLTFQYRLTTEELITREGILHRQERRIPVNRIQDLNFESTLIRRMVGLVVVSVETASGQGSEAKLDSLSRRDAELLREALHRCRSGPVEEAAPRPEEFLLYRSSASELTLLGLTNNRIGAILVACFGLLELADQFGMSDQVGGVVSSLFERLAQFSPPLMVVIFAAVLFLVLLAGWLLSITASFVMFHGFSLTLREDVLQRRFGLITTRAQTLPRKKVQRVILGQPLLRRLMRMLVLRADSAGSGMDEKQEARGGRDIIAPLTSLRVGEALVPWLLPGFDLSQLHWQPVSPRVVLRIFLKGVLWCIAGIVILAPLVGLWSLLALAVLPLAWLIGFLSYQNLAYSRAPDHFGFRWGITGRYRAIVPLRKVQGAVLRAGPLERLLGLASLTVYVAGGSPTTQRNLPREEAEQLKIEIARYAAHSLFVW